MTSLFLSNIIHLTQCENSICVISSADLQHWYRLFKVSVSVSILETTVRSLSLNLKLWEHQPKVSVQKNKYWPHTPIFFQRFIYDLQPHDFLISFKYHTFDPIWALNLCHIKCWCASLIPPIQSLSISLNSWDQSESQSQSQLLRPKWKVLVSVSIFETIVKSVSLNLDSQSQQPRVSVAVSTFDTHNQKSQSQSQK